MKLELSPQFVLAWWSCLKS